MSRVVRSVTVSGAVALLALACGGRTGIDNELTAGAGRPSVVPAGGASTSIAGAPSGGAPGAGAPSGGGQGAGAPSAGAPSGGAPNACQSMKPPVGVLVDPAPQDVSGEYQLVTCGQATECTMPGAPAMTQALSDRIELTVAQDPTDLSHGTVTLHGTGELLLDGRALDATFTRRSFEVELRGPINAICNQEYDLSFSYDFDGYGPRTFNLDFERSPNCNGNNGSEYCKGNVHSTFGDAAIVLN